MSKASEKAKKIFGNIIESVEFLDDDEIEDLESPTIFLDCSDKPGVILTFSNGAKVRVRTSEWSWIEKVS